MWSKEEQQMRTMVMAGLVLVATGAVRGADKPEQLVPGKGFMDLVTQTGQPRAIVVVADNPTRPAHVAAREFIHYVRKITGVELPLYADAEAPPWLTWRVLIGESRMTRELGLKNSDFEPQEHLIETRGRNLILMGRDAEDHGLISYERTGLWGAAFHRREAPFHHACFIPMGSLYAVHTFLETHCGVRWYLPGEIGEVCPQKKRLHFRDLHVRTRPWTRYRWSSRINQPDPFDFYEGQKAADYKPKRVSGRDMVLWLLRRKVGGSPFVVNHSFYQYYSRFARTKPQWWADGKPTPHGHLDYLNPELADQAAEDADAYFSGRPLAGDAPKGGRFFAWGDYFAVMALDKSRGWVRTPEAEKLLREIAPGDPDAPSAGFFCGWASEYVFTFVNEIAKRIYRKHPDKWVSTCAYAPFYLPPETVELSPNIAVCVAGGVTNSLHPQDKRYFYDTFGKWSDRVKQVYAWEYYLQQHFGNFKEFPVIFPRRVAEGVSFLRKCGLQGFFFEASGSPGLLANPAEDLLNHTVLWTYLVDDSRPVDELLEEHYRLFYGPAAKPMADFFGLIEQRWHDPAVWQEKASTQRRAWSLQGARETIETLTGHIEQALNLATDDPYRTRVQLMNEAVYRRMVRNAQEFRGREGTRRRLECGRCTAPPVIDGDLGDPAWEAAAPTEPFVTPSNLPASVATVARVLRDDRTLYVAITCPEPTMDKVRAFVTRADDLDVASDCDVELFIDVGRSREKYCHLLINTLGVLADRTVGMGHKGGGLAWSSNARIGVRKHADRFDIEVAAPFESMGVTQVRPGEVWGFNVGRTRGHIPHYDNREPRWTCWSPTFGSFNTPDEFGVLVMTER